MSPARNSGLTRQARSVSLDALAASTGYATAFKLFGVLKASLLARLTLDRVNITRGVSPAMFDVILTGALRVGKDVKVLLGR